MVDMTYLYNVPHDVKLGLLIAVYFFYTGLSAGSFVLSSLGTVFGIAKYKPIARLGVVMAIILLVIAPLHLLADLEQPGRFYELFYRLNATSPISYGTYLLTLYPLNSLIYAWFLFRRDFARGAQNLGGFKGKLYRFLTLGNLATDEQAAARDYRRAKFFGTLGVPLALFVHGYTGFILANVQARALWHTAIMPWIFLMSAVVSGTGLLILLVMLYERFFSPERTITSVRRDLILDIGRLMMWFIVVDASLTISDFITLFYTNAGGYTAAYMFLHGSHKFMFLGVEIGLGMLLPFLMILWPRTGRSLAGVGVASFLTLVGVLAMRINFVIGGQQVPLTGDALNPVYITGTQVGLVLAFAAMAILLFYLAFRLLPLGNELVLPEHKPLSGQILSEASTRY